MTRPAFADPSSWIRVRRAGLDHVEAALRRVPRARLEREAATVGDAGRLLRLAVRGRVERERTRLDHGHDRLRLLGPGATLARGYAIVQGADGAVVQAAASVSVADEIGVRLAEGSLRAEVTEVDG